MEKNINIPLSVPSNKKNIFTQNYLKATQNSENLFLFAGDQKIEHLNTDFYGANIPQECADPIHLFDIANQTKIGAFTTQLGLIAKYGQDFPNINYVVKLNSKTNLISNKISDPISLTLNSVENVMQLKNNSNLSIVGIGYTIYLGSKYESQMLSQAAQIVWQAHQEGLLTILWIYPRGESVNNELDANIIGGAAGVGVCLGADFIKINPPKATNSLESAKLLNQAKMAAGRTKIICSGGTIKNEFNFIEEIYHQINTGGINGCAIGRNIHQRNISDAIKLCKAIHSIVIEKTSLDQAQKFLN